MPSAGRRTLSRPIVAAIDAAKYPTPGSRGFVRGFRSKRRRQATLEFIPR